MKKLIAFIFGMGMLFSLCVGSFSASEVIEGQVSEDFFLIEPLFDKA